MEIRKQIIKFFNENFMLELDENFNENDSFLEKGIIDSTGVLELVMFLEKTHNIKVEDDEIIPENLDSIKNIASYLDRKLINKNS